MRTERFYEFGPFRLDTLNRSLERDGEPVAIQPKAYEVLLILVQNCGRTVARDELMNAIWGLHVSDGVLSFQINQLRKALKDPASSPRYIQTFPKRGFRFIAAVTAYSEEGPEPSPIEKSPGAAITTVDLKKEKDNSFIYDERSIRQPTRLRDSAVISTRAAETTGQSMPAALFKRAEAFGGHLFHVLACSAIYATLYAVGLLAEIAYEFDKYGRAGLVVASAVYAWVFVTSLVGFNVAHRLTLRGSTAGLLVSLSIFLLAAILSFVGACLFLPSSPVTQARFQTYTAEAAYLKTIMYFLLIVPFYMLAPFHFIITLEREMECNACPQVLRMLTGSSFSVYPKGSFYLKPWVLLLMLSIIIATAFFLHSNLFDNLVPAAYTNLFSILIHIRLILYFALGLTCLAWYYQLLNNLKLKCLSGRAYG